MATFEHGSVSISVDEDGFMQEPEAWNKIAAAALATTEGVDDLTDDHWKVVDYLRDYYIIHRTIPTVYETCTANDSSLEELRELFPAGYRRGACRIAGLPFYG